MKNSANVSTRTFLSDCFGEASTVNESQRGKMKIIAGLGNPGKKYEKTRHNCGYAVIDILADRYRIDVNRAKFNALCGTGIIDGVKVLLLKPLTYMNLSGEALRAACDFYQADPDSDVIVICDDVSMPTGQLRIRTKGSAGGHNGLKSIISHLGTEGFTRIKVGVGEKPVGMDLADYVLGHFPLSEQADMIDAFERASRAAAALLTQEPTEVMSIFNKRINTAEENVPS